MKHQRGTRAEGIAALKFTDAMKDGDPLKGKPPTLREYSKDFLEWVKTGRLEKDSRRYYRNGWRLLEKVKIAGKRMDKVSKGRLRMSGTLVCLPLLKPLLLHPSEAARQWCLLYDLLPFLVRHHAHCCYGHRRLRGLGKGTLLCLAGLHGIDTARQVAAQSCV